MGRLQDIILNDGMGRKITALTEIVLGNILYALAVQLFLIPAELVTSGATGISIVLHEVTGIPVAPMLLVLNVAMLILGRIFLGRAFALSTLLSTFITPMGIAVWARLLGDYRISENLLLCAIFSGLGIGLSLGVVLRAGSSTGGTDIPPLILKKYFGVPLSVSFYILDFLIIVTQGVVYSPEKILYGIIVVLISTMAMDRMLFLGTTRTEVKIISDHSDEIRQAILRELERGVTLLDGQTGYTNRRTQIVLSVVYNRELPRLERLIHEIDSESFMIISRISEVHGRGFTPGKK
ncbi:MAG: YitT family protein [Stomatobaculum sp.]